MISPRASMPSLFEQAMGCAASAARAKADAEKPAWPPNPFPKGPQPGSTTEQIIAALQQAHPCWIEHWELMQVTGRSRGAISWALRYMAEHGMVRSIRSAKHPSYFRYQAVISVKE